VCCVLVHGSKQPEQAQFVHVQASCASASMSPLHEPAILQHVLSYVGLGHWCFVGPVCSLWRDAYARLSCRPIDSCSEWYRTVVSVSTMTLYSSALETAARAEHAINSCGLDQSAEHFLCAAGRYADAETLAAAHALGMPYSAELMQGAAAVGALDNMIWLHTEQQCALPSDISSYAVCSGSVPVLRWLQQQGVSYDAESCRLATDRNHLSALQFLHTDGCADWNIRTCNAAVSRGHLAVLRYAREQGCPWDACHAMVTAVCLGHVNMAEFVINSTAGTSAVALNEHTMRVAAERGHTDMCKYLHTQRCPWSISSCIAAAEGNHVDTLRWLYEQNAPWNGPEIFLAAAEWGAVAVMQYLQTEGLLLTAAQLTNALAAAGAYSKLVAAQWLRAQGAEWPLLLRYSSEQHGYARCTVWKGAVLEWARNEGCDSPTSIT
jgi:hypothetical protein